jgi:5-formyltetrahydrofolate cyclo-ligase
LSSSFLLAGDALGRLSGVRSTRDTLRNAARAKQAIRERVWALLERKGASRFPGARGRIPNFVGAEAAAERLAQLPEWKRARVLKANPDSPQLPVRTRALAGGKLVYMAVPRLTDRKPFILLDPDRLKVPPRRAASIRGASAAGRKVSIDEMRPVDLVVCGTVAVNHKGVRVGKGGGYSDLEFALLVDAGLITDRTLLVTTVHPLQVLDEELPETDHDFRVGRIVTPDEVISCRRTRRPPGILWDHLDEDKIGAIPVLRALYRTRS